MEDNEQNKSEQATPFKLQRAREKGSVARGADLGFLTALVGFTGYAWIAGPHAAEQIAQNAKRTLVAAPNILASPNEILAVTGFVLSSIAQPVAFMAAVVFVVVLLFELVQTGVVFSTQPLKPDFNRLNPAQNFKKLFSLKLLIETAKNILKIAIYSVIACGVIMYALNTSLFAISDARGLAYAMAGVGLRLMLLFAAVAVLFAAADQFINRRDFAKKMRMSRRELRREVRDREGEPRMKQRRKQLHAEFVKLSQSLRGVRGADVLITNPTHYAVGLKYDPRSMQAPTLVCRGTNQLALRLRRLAFLYGVTIVENKALAKALFLKCQLNSEVPEILYQPIADIYTAMRKHTEQKQGAPLDA